MPTNEVGAPYRYLRQVANGIEDAIGQAAQQVPPPTAEWLPRKIDRVTMQRAAAATPGGIDRQLAMELFDAVAKDGVATDRDLYNKVERAASSLVMADANSNGVTTTSEVKNAGISDCFAKDLFESAHRLGG